MHRALALLVFAPLLPLACGSFGASADPETIAEAGGGDSGGTDGGMDGNATSPPTFSGDARAPSLCQVVDCPDGLGEPDCIDDSCDSESTAFAMNGGATRTADRCVIPPDATGFFQAVVPRGGTPSRFVELGFDLVAVNVLAQGAIAELRASGAGPVRVILQLEAGKLKLCAVTATGTRCSGEAIDVPVGKRIHFYGTMNGSATTPQSFGASVGCGEVLRVDVPDPFGQGADALATVGCLDDTCEVTVDELLFATPP